MTEVQMQMRRALWTKRVKDATKDTGYQWTINVEANRTILLYWHPDSPGWKMKVDIAQGRASVQCLVDEKPFAFHSSRLQTLVAHMQSSRERFDALSDSVSGDEAQAKAWLERQDKELVGLEELPWLSLIIIKDGPYAGNYRVEFEPGSPLEHLTLGQAKELHKLCQRLSWKT